MTKKFLSDKFIRQTIQIYIKKSFKLFVAVAAEDDEQRI